jgi:TolB-like protein
MTRSAAIARGRRALAWSGALLLAALTTGGGPPVRHSVGGAIPPDHPATALMPFENLAGREEQSQIFTRVFFAQLVASGALDMIEPVRVEEAMDSLSVRAAASMTPAQVKAMGERLGVRCLMIGSVLESGSVKSDGGEVPTVGATLRMVEAASGRVLWAGVHFRSGEDRETVFGWGRVKSTERLISELASEMLKDFRAAGRRWMDMQKETTP